MQDLVGIPYKEGGASPSDGFDCYGLVRWVIREGLGVSLPENTISWRRYGDVIDGCPSNPLRYDLLFFCPTIPDIVTHVGIANGDGNITHADHRFGAVVCEPLSRYSGKIKAIGRVRT